MRRMYSLSSVNHKTRHASRHFALFLYGILFLLGETGCLAGSESESKARAITPAPAHTAVLTGTPTLTSTPTPTATQRPVLCGGPRAMFILLVGSDARRDDYVVGLADSIRIVRVDFVEASLQVLAFPRDLYVELPGIEAQNGVTHGKLNQAYLYGNPGYKYYDGPGQGPGLLAETLEHNFGAHVDHYVAVNLQSFVRIIDALGGIDMELPYEVDGRVKGSRDSSRYFAAGKQHLDGYRTMLLARMRPQGDFRRAAVQNLILEATARKALSASVILKLPALIKELRESVQTDLGPAEIGQLLCLRTRVETQEIEFLSFPDDLFESKRVRDPVLGNTSILDADFKVLGDFVHRFNEGLWREAHKPIREKITP